MIEAPRRAALIAVLSMGCIDVPLKWQYRCVPQTEPHKMN
jgi:hypothetical protein